MISVKEAREILISNSKPIHTEEVDLLDGLGRILAIDIFSKMNVPSFNNSAMDGYCFQWKEVGSLRSFWCGPRSQCITLFH